MDTAFDTTTVNLLGATAFACFAIIFLVVALGAFLSQNTPPIHRGVAEITELTRIMIGDQALTVGAIATADKGINFLDALECLDDFNKRFGTKVRLISHKTAEWMLAKKKYNSLLVPYSPFWTGTIIAYESRRAKDLGTVISCSQYDEHECYGVVFPTEDFLGHGSDCALTLENVSFEDLEFREDQEGHRILIKPQKRAVETEGFPFFGSDGQLHQDPKSGIPSAKSAIGRKLWLLRKERPLTHGSGGRLPEAVNPFFDNFVTAIVRCAPVGDRTIADQGFSVDADFFEKIGALVEIDPEDMTKLSSPA